jgi:hypothetical protein
MLGYMIIKTGGILAFGFIDFGSRLTPNNPTEET